MYKKLLAFSSLLLLVACESKFETSCRAPAVLPGIINIFLSEDNDAQNRLLRSGFLAETKLIRADETTGSAICATRFVIPTEEGPLDTAFEYRVGPAASSGETVFMYAMLNDDNLEKFPDILDRVSRASVKQNK